jgi:hypothetical protein
MHGNGTVATTVSRSETLVHTIDNRINVRTSNFFMTSHNAESACVMTKSLMIEDIDPGNIPVTSSVVSMCI